MNHGTCVVSGPLKLRTAVVIVTCFAFSVLGLGGIPPSAVADGTANGRVPALNLSQSGTQRALAYSRCMRAHGVPKFPDPNSGGGFPKVSLEQLGVSTTVFQTAQNRCRYLLPNGGSGPSQTEVQQIMSGMLQFARCMRSHGVADWPDPVIDAGGNPEFYLNGRIDQNAPSIESKIHGCEHWIPSEALSPGNPIACPGAKPGDGPICGACSCTRRT
jgi:hypothetical protein